MAIAIPDIQDCAAQVLHLSFEDRVRLLNIIAQSLLVNEPHLPTPRHMVRGQFKGGRMSTEEDFKIAEWHPSEDELNGN